MSNVSAFPDLAAIRETAALWVARADRGLSGAEAEELNLWLANPAHARAYEELGGISNRTEVLSVLADVFPRTAPQSAPPAPRRWLLAGALASCMAVAALIYGPRLGTTVTPADEAAASPVQVFATASGERRSVMLPDGSLLSLNTESEVAVELTAAQRQLSLRRGEAHFEVAHDVSRPFIVTVGAHSVRAVGTAFNIRRRSGADTDVLVTSGIVRVAGDKNEATLKAGQLLALRADGSGRITMLDAAAIESQLAWRRGVLIFDGQTLAEAVTEIDRYTPKHIALADPALGSRRIVGYFPTDDLQKLLQSLQANLDIIVTEDDTQILLSARSARAPPD